MWACNDGFFLLKANENRISRPMAIALGAAAGLLLGLILFRVCCWGRRRNSGRAGAVDSAKRKGISLYIIPISEPTVNSGLENGSKRLLTNGQVFEPSQRDLSDKNQTDSQDEPKETPAEREVRLKRERKANQEKQEREQTEKSARQLRRARNKVQNMVADVAMLVNRTPGGVEDEGDEIAI